MSIKVIHPEAKQARPAFKLGELVISNRGNGNVYLVLGPGSNLENFEGVRLSGRGRVETSTDFIKQCVDLFHGEVVISNE